MYHKDKIKREERGKFSPNAICIRLMGFWMSGLPAASPQYRLTRASVEFTTGRIR